MRRPGKRPQGRGAMPVTVVTLATAPVVLRRELPGRTTPYLVAEVRPQVNGIVKQRLYTEGSAVKAGQPLYQLDDATYQADLASAKAALARAEATLNTARLNSRRSADLFAINAVSKQDDENAMAALKQGEADVAAAAAAVRSAEVILGYARIKAPIDGRIGKSSVTQGALVTANQDAPLATVQQLDPIYVDLTQSSAEWLSAAQGTGVGPARGHARHAGGDRSRRRHALCAVRQARVLAKSASIQRPAASRCASSSRTPSTSCCPACTSAPSSALAPGSQACSSRSKASRATPRATLRAMVVGQDGKVEVRTVRVSQAIGDNGWSRKAWPPATR